MFVVTYETDLPILRATREAVPEMALVVESELAPDVAGPGEDHDPIHLQFWASGGDVAALEAALAADPTVCQPRLLAEVDGRRLYRVLYTEEGMAWTPHHRWVSLDAGLLEATGTADGWQVRMWFPDRSAISRYQAWFDDRGLDFRVTDLLTAAAPVDGDLAPQLTEKQRETVVTAWRLGYFDVPKRIGLVGLAEVLDVSDTAVSQRLRRAIDALLQAEFGDPPEEAAVDDAG